MFGGISPALIAASLLASEWIHSTPLPSSPTTPRDGSGTQGFSGSVGQRLSLRPTRTETPATAAPLNRSSTRVDATVLET